MKNKFEALKAFQSWSRDWQELCAEYWAEGDASVPVALQEGGVRFTGQMLPSQSHECQIKPRKCDANLEKRYRNFSPPKPWSAAETEWLVKLHDSGLKRSEIIMRFMLNHPLRSHNSVASRHDHLRRLGWRVEA